MPAGLLSPASIPGVADSQPPPAVHGRPGAGGQPSSRRLLSLAPSDSESEAVAQCQPE